MAKGRKLTTSRSERYLGTLGGYGEATAAPELREDDVWSVVDEGVNGNREWGSFTSTQNNTSFHRPSQNLHVGGLSLAFDDSANTASQRIVHQFWPQEGGAGSPRGRNIASSAPVNVPDWSRIYRVESVETLHELDDGLNDSEVVPPHEFLARSRNMAANSVFEGVGRTLKGRDMSRVRDAVWSQTGFDG